PTTDISTLSLHDALPISFHESQSLFVEKQIGRSAEFWEWAMPLVRKHLGPKSVEGWEIEDLLLHVHEVKTGLIRVDADETTYPLDRKSTRLNSSHVKISY